MVAGIHRFTVGSFECFALGDGAIESEPPEVPAEVLFANAPRDDLAAALRASGDTALWTRWTEELTCVLAAAGRHRVLIDAGGGDLAPGTGTLFGALAAACVSPTDVDLVVLTHAHPDHVGGLVDGGGSSAYPNARLILSRSEWRFWMEGQAEASLPRGAEFLAESARRTLHIVQPQIELVDDDADVVPGVRLQGTPGHTPGHLAVRLSSAGERLLVVGDALLHPLHVSHPVWVSSFDVDPEATTRTRVLLCAQAASVGCVVHAFHFPFPGLGRIARVEGGHTWMKAPPL